LQYARRLRVDLCRRADHQQDDSQAETENRTSSKHHEHTFDCGGDAHQSKKRRASAVRVSPPG
jgi:hypothetical protein